MSNLIVPSHLEKPDTNTSTKPNPPPKDKKSSIADAYVKPEENLCLDPSKLSDEMVSRMPQPTGWRLLILPFQGKKQSEGGILLTKETVQQADIATVCGYVVKVGPDAYADKNRFQAPWCKQGSWVIFARYAGSRFRIEEGEVRLLNDDEILATIKHPDDILHL